MKLSKKDQEVKFGQVLIRFILPFNHWAKIVINVVAVMVSWYFNKSIGFAILHYIFGFFYLLYCILAGKFVDGALIEIFNSYF